MKTGPRIILGSGPTKPRSRAGDVLSAAGIAAAATQFVAEQELGIPLPGLGSGFKLVALFIAAWGRFSTIAG